MSEGKTPGRLAYEELSRRVGSEYDSWDKLPGDLRAAHEASVAAGAAAAHERTAELVSEVNELRAERDDYARRLRATDESWAKLAAERDRYRHALEVIARDAEGYDRGTNEHAHYAAAAAALNGKHEPAVVTSGTEHLAELIGGLAIGGEDTP